MAFRSAGLEEYIEGLSFLHYLEHGSLISLEEVQATLSEKESGENVCLSLNPGPYADLVAGRRHTRGLAFGDVGSDRRVDAIRYQR